MGSSAEALEKNRHSKHPIKAISFGTDFLISKSSLYKSRLFMSVSFHRGTSVFLKPVLDIVQIAVLSPLFLFLVMNAALTLVLSAGSQVFYAKNQAHITKPSN
jgi:hypothetical protein